MSVQYYKNGQLKKVSENIVSYDNGVPVGAIIPYSGSTIPNGYEQVSNSDLAEIFKICYPVGSYYWSSDDLSPNDLYGANAGTWIKMDQARFMISAGSLTRRELIAGDTGGNEKHTITEDELPAHTHTYYKAPSSTGGHSLTIAQMPAHNHSYHVNIQHSDGQQVPSSEALQTGLQVSGRRRYNDNTDNTGSGQAHSHTITNTSDNTGSTGDNTTIDMLPPYIAANCWHRTA